MKANGTARPGLLHLNRQPSLLFCAVLLFLMFLPGKEKEALLSPLPDDPSLVIQLELNSAGVSELESLPGIGPSLAGRIDDLRREKGGFRRIEEIMEVRGIGEKRFAALKSYLTVEAISRFSACGE